MTQPRRVGDDEGVVDHPHVPGPFVPSKPLTTRSVVATTLLGSPDGGLPVAHLRQIAALFGIGDSAVRTCLSRMVANGELTASEGVYELTGTLAERRLDVVSAVRPRHSDRNWDGTWEIAIARAGSRSATARHELRTAATRLGLGFVRDGCWARPNNLDRGRHAAARAVVEQQCLTFVAARTDSALIDCEQLFALSDWAQAARHLHDSIAAETARTVNATDDRRRQFLLAIAATRHLRTDPLLPRPLLPDDWPGDDLRSAYRELRAELGRHLAAGEHQVARS